MVKKKYKKLICTKRATSISMMNHPTFFFIRIWYAASGEGYGDDDPLHDEAGLKRGGTSPRIDTPLLLLLCAFVEHQQRFSFFLPISSSPLFPFLQLYTAGVFFNSRRGYQTQLLFVYKQSGIGLISVFCCCCSEFMFIIQAIPLRFPWEPSL